MSGLPYNQLKTLMDARLFVRRMEQLRKKAAARLNAVHRKMPRHSTVPEKVFKPKDLVWYLRPQIIGDKLESRWLGPAPVVQRVSKRGYTIEVKPGKIIHAPLVFLKGYVPDVYAGLKAQLHFHTRTAMALPPADDEWEVDRLIQHKIGTDGRLMFLTKWKGYASPTWEPVQKFITVYNTDLVKYCKEKNVTLDLGKHLRTEPSTHPITQPTEPDL